MLTAPDGHQPRGWLRFGGAILVLLLVAGCGAAGPSGSRTGRTPGPSVAASPSPSAALSSEDAAALLATALGPLRASSSFETVVEVDGTTVVRASGRASGGASRVSVTTSGETVEYVEIPPKAWARQASAKWVLVAATQAPVAPLDVLAGPSTLVATSPSVFQATYPATALGLEGDPVSVTITLADDTVVFRYDATTDGHRTSSTTTIRPAPADPIAAPAT